MVGRVTACPEQSRMGARRGSACPRNKSWWIIPDSFETKQVSAELHQPLHVGVSVMLAGTGSKQKCFEPNHGAPVTSASERLRGGHAACLPARASVLSTLCVCRSYACAPRHSRANPPATHDPSPRPALPLRYVIA